MVTKVIAVDHADLGRRYGIHFMRGLSEELSGMKFMDPTAGAYDAQPTLITNANAGIPSLFTTWVDPKIIEVLVAPTKAARFYGEVKKGTWVSDTAMFMQAERTGEVATYDDFSQDGMSNANVTFPQRQSYHFQTNARWGERQLARAAEAKIDWANRVNMGVALALLKFQNRTYLYGVGNLQCYGGTNDPSLPPAIAPTSSWFGGNPAVIYTDIQRMVQQIVVNTDGLVDAESRFRMGISPGNLVNLTDTNSFNVNVMDQIKKNFPNMEIITIPEFAINGGGGVAGGTELVQLFAVEIEAQPTCEAGFTEKKRAHAMITKASSWEQKHSGGTWGTIIYKPVMFSQLLG